MGVDGSHAIEKVSATVRATDLEKSAFSLLGLAAPPTQTGERAN